jgi:hypothetical protein
MHRVLDRGAWVASVMLVSVTAGCTGTPLATPHPVDAGAAGSRETTPTMSAAGAGGAAGSAGGAAGMAVVPPGSLVIPEDVVPPVMSCSDGSSYALALPCQLGMGPVFETDCGYGPGGQSVLRFMLPASLPDAGGSLVSGPPLGRSELFRALFVPGPGAGITSGDLPYALTSMTGTVTFTKGSLADRTLDGWFTHLDFVFTSGDLTLSCTLDQGRFTTVPGDYL